MLDHLAAHSCLLSAVDASCRSAAVHPFQSSSFIHFHWTCDPTLRLVRLVEEAFADSSSPVRVEEVVTWLGPVFSGECESVFTDTHASCPQILPRR